jgi:DNA-binding NtrC family response regulator
MLFDGPAGDSRSEQGEDLLSAANLEFQLPSPQPSPKRRGSRSGSVFNYLVMTAGPREGTQFLLAEGKQNRIGRGLECDVILADPLSSRVHAVITFENDQWWVRDASSRNGTFVSGQKIDEAQLIDGAMLKVGSTEFKFCQSSARPTDTSRLDRTQTVIRDRSVALTQEPGEFGLDALRDDERAHDFLTLHQLSMKLLGCSDPDEVVRVSLELLRERTRASVVGFLWASDDGQLKPKLVIPEDAAGKVQLSGELTEMVTRQGKAIWIDNQELEGTTKVLQHYADAICVPLFHHAKTLGAMHVYLEKGRFRQADFDVAIPLANILTVALVRARRETVLKVDQQRLADKAAVSDELLGESRPIQELKSRIGRVARATGCVLIRGESGSGKELVARAVHRSSARSDRPMLTVNCAAIPRDLMESQLFGHKRGSFTGADADHVGLFQQAHTGTLFLDEVGEMTLDGQAKLLRILEGHPFLPVGATKEVNVDVRVIAATNRDLREFVRDGRFREDLYYRLSVFELYIPPLRDRGGDVELLVTHFLDHFKRQHGRPGLTVSPDSKEKLLAYSWPGNVRQLRNVIDSAVVMCEGSVILPDDLGLRDASHSDQLESLRIDFWERKLIQEALKRTSGSIPEAARLLGLGRATLYRKVEEYGIERK